jgi:ABC-type antimicrobial peptide transport system permease subunit
MDGDRDVALLAVVSAAVGLIPARRASQSDPILALRYESPLSD